MPRGASFCSWHRRCQQPTLWRATFVYMFLPPMIGRAHLWTKTQTQVCVETRRRERGIPLHGEPVRAVQIGPMVGNRAVHLYMRISPCRKSWRDAIVTASFKGTVARLGAQNTQTLASPQCQGCVPT